MDWYPASTGGIDAAQAETAGTQAAQFLIEAVHAEVDGAQIDPVQVLMDAHSPGQAIYAAATVTGPLRAYLVTAWGRAGHVAGKQIVSYPSSGEAQQALSDTIHKHTTGQGSTRAYLPIGTYRPAAADEKGAR